MRALVVGGTGFIGLNIVDALLASGASVRVTRRKQSITVLLKRRPVELVDASLEEPDKLRRAMEGCDVVYLAGAHYPRYSIDREATLREGLLGVENACQAAIAAKVPRLVYTSTIATLDRAPEGRLADERDVPATIPTESVYRAVKWAMERAVDRAGEAGLSTVTLMPGGCIGPGDLRLGTGSVIAGVVRGLLPWWVDGLVNIIDVGDVARAHVAAAAKTPHDRYALGGHALRVPEFLHRIKDRFGGSVPTLELSADDGRARAHADELAAAPSRERVAVPREFVDMVTMGQRVSNARAEADLGLTLTPLDDALDRAYAFLSRFGFVPRLATKGNVDEHARY